MYNLKYISAFALYGYNRTIILLQPVKIPYEKRRVG